MNQDDQPPQLQAFRVGPKNRRIDEEAGAASGYDVLVESNLALPELLARHGVSIAAGETRITPKNFPHALEPAVTRHFELFDFSARSDYGRRGVDEAFVHDKLDHFKFRPATLVELVCFASRLREIYRDQWFEAKSILALGSVLTTRERAQTGGFFRKIIAGDYRHYPELECVAGRPHDVLGLSRTECNSDGNWPSATLFLAAALA